MFARFLNGRLFLKRSTYLWKSFKLAHCGEWEKTEPNIRDEFFVIAHLETGRFLKLRRRRLFLHDDNDVIDDVHANHRDGWNRINRDKQMLTHFEQASNAMIVKWCSRCCGRISVLSLFTAGRWWKNRFTGRWGFLLFYSSGFVTLHFINEAFFSELISGSSWRWVGLLGDTPLIKA